ncbi:MAG: hypothetical protein H0V96_07420 [Acidimicrobiia bacterium]|nr:hypothetical protein [Acidimicrobiia bacterium]
MRPPPLVKVAVTDRATVIDTTHEPVPVHAPDHPVNVDPRAARAVNVTDVPEVYDSVQSVPQLIPAGELVTAPDPVPILVTVSVKVVVGGAAPDVSIA